MAEKRLQTHKAVLKWMQMHPGEIHHYKDIANALGGNFTIFGINASLARMVKYHPDYGVTREGSGLYLYRVGAVKAPQALAPEPKREGPMMYEEVGTTQSGDVIVRDEKGVLWKLSGAL